MKECHVTATGDRVRISMGGKTMDGVVTLASRNGKSLVLEFDGALGGEGIYCGMMPVTWSPPADGGFGPGVYHDLIEGAPVEIEYLGPWRKEG
jgi:hypothetical protein